MLKSIGVERAVILPGANSARFQNSQFFVQRYYRIRIIMQSMGGGSFDVIVAAIVVAPHQHQLSFR
jgi:hypothetical protein